MEIFQVNAFTDELFKGNPAGVVLVKDFFDSLTMQNIAAELNFSETAFVKELSANHYHIRWFSPLDEAPICGHATIASAHIIMDNLNSDNTKFTFDSLAGPLISWREGDHICLDLPRFNVKETAATELLNKAMNYVPFNTVLRDETMYMVVLPTAEDVQNFKPSYSRIKDLDCRALLITAISDDSDNDIDFVSRYFAPKVGIYEDPVCGSAHCRLAPYWANIKGKNVLKAKQLSKRTGIIFCEVKNERVVLKGKTVLAMRGEMKNLQQSLPIVA